MIFQDLKYAFKTLRKTPLLTGTAVVALALGIGANTALFSVIDAVLLRPLQYPHPERMVELMRHYPGEDEWATTPTKFDFWRQQSQSFEAVAASSFLSIGLNLVGRGEPQRLAAMGTSADYFRVLGVQPSVGRMYRPAEDKPGAGKYAVLSDKLWRKLFGGDRSAVGKTLSLSNESYQVIGVMPRGFDSPLHADLWIPLQMKIEASDRANDYPVIARLKPGVSLAMARADMGVVAERFRKAFGADLMGRRESIAVVRFRDFLVGDAKRPLWILLGAVSLVLLIACANVANLLLARSAVRQREMAVRVAVGAGSGAIVRLLLTESMVLALAGAGAGCVLAGMSLPLLLRLAPTAIPQLAGSTVDWRVLLYALAVAILTGVLFGLFPAMQSARSGIANALREAGTKTTRSAAAQRVRQALVVAEIAITLLLLVGASLLIRTLTNLEAVPPGFDAKNVLTMQMSLSNRYADSKAVAQLNTRVASRLAAIPGVVSVATTNLPPLTAYMDLPFEIVGRPVKTDDMPDEKYRFVSPNYFATLRMPVRQGREFTERDTMDSEPVMLINEALAKKYFSRQNPLDQQIVIGRIMGPIFADKPRRIVGVVGNLHDDGLDQPAPPEMFEPEGQVPRPLMALSASMLPLHWMVRTTRDPMSLAGTIQREALTVAGDLPMAEPRPLGELVTESLARHKFVMTLLSVFAGLALLLGAVGLYGVISYSVAQRTRELGLRSALGARPADLLRLVVGEGLRLTGVGLALGLVFAFGLTRFLQSLLFGVSSSDPVVLVAVTAMLGLIGLTACFVPAYRASLIDPVVALRQE